MVFDWYLSDNRFHVSKTLLNVLADLNNAVVLMVSTRPLISKSSSLFSNLLGIIPSAPITTDITVTLMLHSFFSQIFIPHFAFFLLCGLLERQNRTVRQVLLFIHLFIFIYFQFFFFLLSLGLVVRLRFGDPFVSQNPREFCASHSLGRIPGCAYTTCSYGQISVSCIIPCGSPFPPSHV